MRGRTFRALSRLKVTVQFERGLNINSIRAGVVKDLVDLHAELNARTANHALTAGKGRPRIDSAWRLHLLRLLWA